MSTQQIDPIFVRREVGQAMLGDLGRAAWYAWIRNGLLPEPVALGGKLKVYPLSELQEVARAWTAGATEPEIRELVSELVASRRRS